MLAWPRFWSTVNRIQIWQLELLEYYIFFDHELTWVWKDGNKIESKLFQKLKLSKLCLSKLLTSSNIFNKKLNKEIWLWKSNFGDFWPNILKSPQVYLVNFVLFCFGNNLHFRGCETVCFKSEVMLLYVHVACIHWKHFAQG